MPELREGATFEQKKNPTWFVKVFLHQNHLAPVDIPQKSFREPVYCSATDSRALVTKIRRKTILVLVLKFTSLIVEELELRLHAVGPPLQLSPQGDLPSQIQLFSPD